MRVAAVLRNLLAPLIFPLTLLSCYVVTSRQTEFDVGYAPWQESQILSSLGLVAPIAAGACAWYASAQRAYKKRLVVSRNREIAWWLYPTVTNALFLTAVMALSLLGTFQTLPSFIFLIHSFIVLLGASCFGFACGLHLPLVLSLPLALAVAWIPNLFPATSPEWLRLLHGASNIDCCSPDSVISGSALTAGLMFAGGVAMASLTVIIGWRHAFPRAQVGAFVLSVTLCALAVTSVHGKGFHDALAPRPDSVQCQGSGPQLCSWRDGVEQRDSARSWYDKAARISEDTGVPIPATVTSQRNVSWPSTSVTFGYLPSDGALRDVALSGSLVPIATECEDMRILAAQHGLTSWWNQKLGVSGSGSSGLPGEQIFTAKLQALSSEDRQAYAQRLINAIQACKSSELPKP